MRAYGLSQAEADPESITALYLQQADPARLQRLLPRLRRLKTLELSHCRLESIPEPIAGFDQLEKLVLNHNPIRHIPDWLPFSLRHLELQHSQLKRAPSCKALPPQLDHLDLSNNQLRQLPEDLHLLKNLQMLILSQNNIHTLSRSISQLNQLRILNLAHNQLTNLPSFFFHLTALEKLVLSHNQVAQLPSGIGKCRALYELNLSHNRIRKLPKSLFELPYLRILHLDHNRIPRLSSHLGKLQWLGAIYLAHNQIKRLPGAIGKCRQLQHLDLQYNHLSALPTSLSSLKQLRQLALDHNQLKKIPALPPNLKSLSIDHNQLSSFPPSVARLDQLKQLSLKENPIPRLPRTVSQMKSLAGFSISTPKDGFTIETLLHLPGLISLEVDNDQVALLLELLQLNPHLNLSFAQKKALFFFSQSPSPLSVRFLLKILNSAGPHLSLAIRKKLTQEGEKNALKRGCRIRLIGQLNQDKELLEQRLQKLGIEWCTITEQPDYFLLAALPYNWKQWPKKKKPDGCWINSTQLMRHLHNQEGQSMSLKQQKTILRLIGSAVETQKVLGLQLLRGIGMDASLWRELFFLWKKNNDEKMKKQLFPLLEWYADEEQRFILLSENS